MKTIPPPCPEPETGPRYWRSLDELAETPEFRQWVEREFPAGASELTDPVSRRHFVKIMSASFLFAGLGLTGCRRPEENILPYSRLPEGYVHGTAQFYATARPTRGSAIPLLVKSSDGRPTKIEGNPEHPATHGGTDAQTQASILNLYDPDRANRFLRAGNEVPREQALEFLGQLAQQFQGNTGEGLCFLMERSSSPSRERLQKLIAERMPKARWFVYEPIDFEIQQQAASAAFGQSVAPEYRLDKARRILSLDCDFVGSEQDAYRLIRGFARGRRTEKSTDDMSRLYVVEGLFTLTGASADHRLRVAPSQVTAIVARLAAEIMGANAPAGLAEAGRGISRNDEWIRECAKDLRQAGKSALVLAGHRQPLAVHLLAHALNSALGAVGETVVFRPVPATSSGSIVELAEALRAGQVTSLVILGGNPVYNAPADLDWPALQAKAKSVVRLGYYEDESAMGAAWHYPAAHYLESWGDAIAGDGSAVCIQPLVEPLFGGLTEIEFLARIAGVNTTRPYDIVRDTFKELTKSDSDAAWKKFVHDGFLAESQPKSINVAIQAGALTQELAKQRALPAPSAQQLEVVFHRDYSVDDGRYSNNGWLQEMPDPITKMTWENVVLVSEKTAADLGLKIKDHENNRLKVPVVRVQVNGREIEGPAWIQPGMADNIVGLALGYGRTKSGRVGKNLGYDAYRLRTTAAMYTAAGSKVSATGKLHLLATTQNHWAMEGRPIVREANLEGPNGYRQHPEFAKGMNADAPPSAQPLYPNPLDQIKEQGVHQWGMAIDLSTCVGCSACVMACQSENNIPIVGKEQVTNNREMHWIRIDRYYTGSVAQPQLVYQPMLCQHCEAAPCESVCPVNATVHDEEGLNVMVYNRCVGTRYCSNNCPYKVRRFNYFDYNKRPLNALYKSPMVSATDGEWEMKRWFKNPDKGSKPEDEWDLMKLVRNPDVTVRMRGVMEKCTFCVQRIEQAKIAQKVKARASADVEIPDGTFTTACAQACPAEAIVFGNISDPNSRVSKAKAQDRNYTVLEFLATKPRLTYLARVRNPNPAILDDYKEMPGSLQEFSNKNGRHGEPFESHAMEGGHPAHGAPEHTKKGAH